MDRVFVETGGRMRLARKALGLIQARVAEAAGIDGSFYGQVERGKSVPSLRTFLSITISGDSARDMMYNAANEACRHPPAGRPPRPGARERA